MRTLLLLAVIAAMTASIAIASEGRAAALSGKQPLIVVSPFGFKGFADTVVTLPTTSPANSCGSTWSSTAGNSPPPTTDVPAYMGVIVTSSVAKSGTTVSGNFSEIVVVITDPGYAPGPGHSGTGRIAATFCQ